MTPDDELLLRILRWDWDPTSWRPATIAHDIDWAVVVQSALHHGVAGLVCRSLIRLPAGAAPKDIVDAAGVYLADADANGTALVAQLFDILDVLAADEIPALPFKGPVLGMLAHASATIRPSRDIDVLVHRADMDRAAAALRRLGYRLGESISPRALAAYYDDNGQVILFAEGRTAVEPHWAFAPRALDVNLDMNSIWDRARPLELARVKRTRWQPWVFLVHGEWGQSPWHAGTVRFYAALSTSRHRWALMAHGFPTRIAAVAEADRALSLEDSAGAMLRRLAADGGEYVDCFHDRNDEIDFDRMWAVYRGEVEVSDRKGNQ